jgi:hypothetical protein
VVTIERFVFTACKNGEHEKCWKRRKRPSLAFSIIYICICKCHIPSEVRRAIEESKAYIEALKDDE